MVVARAEAVELQVAAELAVTEEQAEPVAVALQVLQVAEAAAELLLVLAAEEEQAVAQEREAAVERVEKAERPVFLTGAATQVRQVLQAELALLALTERTALLELEVRLTETQDRQAEPAHPVALVVRVELVLLEQEEPLAQSVAQVATVAVGS